MAVVQAHELRAVVIPTTALQPELRRLQRGHHDLIGTRGIHLFANDGLDLLEHAKAQGQERVDPACGLAEHA